MAATALLSFATLAPLGAVSMGATAAHGATVGQAQGAPVAAAEPASSSTLEPRADPFADDPANGRGFVLLAGLTVAVVTIGALFARSVRRAQSQRDPTSPYFRAEAETRPGQRAKSADGS